MAGVYRPRHPERTVLYRVLFHHFDRFLAEYEIRFEREYGFFRTIDREVVERYLDCSNPKCGFARIRCPDCGEEGLLGHLCRGALRSLTRYFEVVAGSTLTTGFITVIQTFGDQINLHPHLHFLVTEGGVDEAGGRGFCRQADSEVRSTILWAARAAVENAACRLYPPLSPSMSRTSPTKKRRGTSLDSIVFGLISASDTPPRVTIAS